MRNQITKKSIITKKGETTFLLLIIAFLVLLLIIIYIFSKTKINVIAENKVINNTEQKEENTNINIYEEKNPKENIIEIKKEVEDATVPIFMYHSVTNDMSYIEYPENAVSPEQLEKQIQTIIKNSYETIFINEVNDLSKYKKPIALTFDDGFEDFYKYAFPLIKKYNIKATLFVITGYINGKYYCTLDQLKEMNASGLVRIESHTRSHTNLAKASSKKVEEELSISKTHLKDYINYDSEVLCYPLGKTNKEVIEKVKEKYKYAVVINEAVYKKSKNNIYEIPRIYVQRSMALSTFERFLSTSNVILYKE